MVPDLKRLTVNRALYDTTLFYWKNDLQFIEYDNEHLHKRLAKCIGVMWQFLKMQCKKIVISISK